MAESSSKNDLGDELVISEEPDKTLEQQIVEAWEKLSLLTLDGGGIRGYWSLLALNKLMGLIAEEEERRSIEENDYHSFYPQSFPANVSHLDMTEEENARLDQFPSDGQFKAWNKEKRFLPCHYFDYIGGTSTGGLIAIMLGRLRMTVPDCIKENETFAGKIFGNPRHFTALKFGVGGRSKYDADKLKEVFRDVTYRRGEYCEEKEPLRFRSKTNTCRSFVTSLRANTDEKGIKTNATVQLIRSYDCTREEATSHKMASGSTLQSRGTHSVMAGKPKEQLRGHPFVTMGPADNFEIWEVARAATAAPFYFDAIEIETRNQASNRVMTYEDGGLGQTTNPTSEGIKDITRQQGADAVGIVVSVGTARGEFGRQKDIILAGTRRKLMHIVWPQSDPQTVHRNVLAERQHYPNMQYWRLNPSSEHPRQLLNMPLDEWEPKRSRKTGQQSGATTMSQIQVAFAEWAQQSEVQRELEECAQSLVEQRRLRTQDDAKWERFSMAIDYRCRQFKCPKLSSKFTNLPEFEHHMKNAHGIKNELELKNYKKSWGSPWRYPRPSR